MKKNSINFKGNNIKNLELHSYLKEIISKTLPENNFHFFELNPYLVEIEILTTVLINLKC